MKFNGKKIAIGVVVVAIVAGGAWFFLHKQNAPFEVSYETAKVEKATIGNSVTATGTIEAVTSVEVGTQVSGIISCMTWELSILRSHMRNVLHRV